MSLEIIMGPMFSGKTTELCRRVRRHDYTNHKVMVINHISDSRYGAAADTLTHDNMSCPSLPVANLKELYARFDYTNTSYIYVNEAQFFNDLVDFCKTAVDVHQKHVIVFGLDGDFERKAFGQILHLIPLANKIHKLTAMCRCCGDGTEALFTKRTTAEAAQILVGGDDKYMAVCRKHYIS